MIKSYFSILFAVAVLLVSCQEKTNESKQALVFKYNESANITSLDPAFAKTQSNIWVCNQLFSGLVQLNDSLKIQPDLAKNHTISADGKTYTFILRDDVFFHQNQIFGKSLTRKVDAHDFEFSFKRLTDEKIASPGGWILQQVDSFKAVNDTVFQIQLKQSFPAFLGLLTMKYASVVPKEIGKLPNYDFRAHPIGTGPFQFKIWEENVKLVLRKNPLYFEKDAQGKSLPYLEAVSIQFLPDKQSGFLEFIQGKIDFVSGLDPSYKDEILTPQGQLQKKYESSVAMISGDYLNTEYLGFKMDDAQSPIHDKRIRQALNYGFDREKLIKYLRNGIGTPAINGFIPSGLPGFNKQKGYDYQPEKSQQLIKSYLQEKNIKTLPPILLSTNASYVDIAEYLQREWQKAGLPVSVDVNPPSTLRQSISTGKVNFFRASWIADYPDAENYLSLFYSKNFSPNGPNYTHFKNQQFDALYEKALQSVNETERIKLYQQMDAIIIQEAPIVPLFYDKVVRFTRKNVQGLGINPQNSLQLKTVRKTND